MSKVAMVIGVVLALIVLSMGLAIPTGYVLMLLLGACSHWFDVPVLALSFWQSYLLGIMLSTVIWMLKGGNSK